MKGPGFLILAGIGALLWWEPGLVGLRVAAVSVQGRQHIPRALSDSLASQHTGFTMGISTCRSLERAFTNLPLVESAQVTRVWPDTLRLEIEERPLIARASSHNVSFDASGNQYRSLEEVSESLPELLGWSPDNQPVWEPAFEALDIAHGTLPSFTRGASVYGPPVNGFVTLVTQASSFSILLPCPPDPELTDRLEYLPLVTADARNNGESPFTIDLRWTNQIVLGFDERQGPR